MLSRGGGIEGEAVNGEREERSASAGEEQSSAMCRGRAIRRGTWVSVGVELCVFSMLRVQDFGVNGSPGDAAWSCS